MSIQDAADELERAFANTGPQQPVLDQMLIEFIGGALQVLKIGAADDNYDWWTAHVGHARTVVAAWIANQPPASGG